MSNLRNYKLRKDFLRNFNLSFNKVDSSAIYTGKLFDYQRRGAVPLWVKPSRR